MVRTRNVAASLLVVAALAVAAANPSASAGTKAARQASLRGWHQVSTGPVSTIDSVSVARFGQQLQAVWRVEKGGNDDLASRIVSLTGAPVGVQIDPLAGTWGTLNEYPVIISDNGQRLIAFSGIQNIDSTNPFSQGYQYVASSADGRHWTLTSQSLTNSASAYGSYGTDVAMVAGTPLTAYTAGTARGVSYRLGAPKPIPTSPAPDSAAHVDSECCTYNTGLGYDSRSHQAWTVWYENSELKSTDGIDAQRLTPSLGGVLHAPGSTQPDGLGDGKYSSVQLNHRIKVAARLGGGLYVGYSMGYPSNKKVALWRIGATSAMTRSARGDVGAVGASAGIKGRIWLYWWSAGSHSIQVARTSPDAKVLGTTCAIGLPAGVDNVDDLVGNASNGPLTLFALAGGATDSVYSKVVGGCLGVAVSPHRLSHTRKGRVHVYVTDAGSPVRGATVHFRGSTKKTNRHGKVTFRVAKGAKKGRYAVTVTKAGFLKATHFVKIR